MATSGMLTDNPSRDYREELAISTCEITMTGVGGPLINFDGDFIGMNFYAEKETPFLPRNIILELLKQFSERIPSWAKKGPGSTVERFPIPRSLRGGEKKKDKKPSICTLCDPECQPGLKDQILNCKCFHARWPYSSAHGIAEKEELRSNGYPFPLWEDIGRRLVNSFEEEFSEIILSELQKEVVSNMSQSVVALASFIGGKRCFACTGVVIECNESTTRVLTSASLVRTSVIENKVADNLKIIVCLPDNRIIRGTLQHISPNYNIAVVDITGFCCTRAARMSDQVQLKPHGEVVALGRIYRSGKLMATSGVVTSKPSELNCKDLVISTCKITKAGIGGPLIDFEGNFIGMNFYGLEETPYIPMNIILEFLGSFGAQRTIAIDDHSLNRWPVPKPFWCYPTWHLSEEEIDVDEFLADMNVPF
jgi:S1-C subfamily serine protease